MKDAQGNTCRRVSRTGAIRLETIRRGQNPPLCTLGDDSSATVSKTVTLWSATVAQTVVHDLIALSCSWANVTAATWAEGRLFVEVNRKQLWRSCTDCTQFTGNLSYRPAGQIATHKRACVHQLE